MFGLPLYLRNVALSTPIKRSSNGPAYEMCKKRQKKREGNRERKEENMRDQIAKKKKKKKKKKNTTKQKAKHNNNKNQTSPCAYILVQFLAQFDSSSLFLIVAWRTRLHTFSHRDPCAMTSRKCKKLAVLDCEG